MIQDHHEAMPSATLNTNTCLRCFNFTPLISGPQVPFCNTCINTADEGLTRIQKYHVAFANSLFDDTKDMIEEERVWVHRSRLRGCY